MRSVPICGPSGAPWPPTQRSDSKRHCLIQIWRSGEAPWRPDKCPKIRGILRTSHGSGGPFGLSMASSQCLPIPLNRPSNSLRLRRSGSWHRFDCHLDCQHPRRQVVERPRLAAPVRHEWGSFGATSGTRHNPTQNGDKVSITMANVQVKFDDRTPIYQQVAAELRRDIGEGEAKPGERLPPAKDLAAVLGVNSNTVLRALRVFARRRARGVPPRPRCHSRGLCGRKEPSRYQGQGAGEPRSIAWLQARRAD